MNRDDIDDARAAQTLGLVGELHQMETERDNALLERDKALGVAADALDIIDRLRSGRAVDQQTVDQLHQRIDSI